MTGYAQDIVCLPQNGSVLEHWAVPISSDFAFGRNSSNFGVFYAIGRQALKKAFFKVGVEHRRRRDGRGRIPSAPSKASDEKRKAAYTQTHSDRHHFGQLPGTLLECGYGLSMTGCEMKLSENLSCQHIWPAHCNNATYLVPVPLFSEPAFSFPGCFVICRCQKVATLTLSLARHANANTSRLA